VLVGDAGERDPEIYGNLARRYPQQVARMLIRNVTDESADSARFREASHGLRPGVWQTFRAASEIVDSCPPRPGR
jgi:phosphatidate phosphatase APP1